MLYWYLLATMPLVIICVAMLMHKTGEDDGVASLVAATILVTTAYLCGYGLHGLNDLRAKNAVEKHD